MNDREILTAALRWYTAYEIRLAHGTVSNKFKTEQKKRTGFGGADFELSGRVTAAKRVELAALRKLAKACKAARHAQGQVSDADVLDVRVRLVYETP
jgi:CRISPR/Cas system endoribonuclease Cas6 (RAMP superfamily)